MLELQNILWVIPGVIFIYMYNKRRPADSITVSGWPYVFSLVFIAVFTWLPVEILLKTKLSFIGVWEGLVASILSGLIAFCLALSLKKSLKIIAFNIQDAFLTNCIEWEKLPVILSLQNNKVYIGILLKYPENPRAGHASQMISIMPIISGGRNKNTQEVQWGDYYPTNDPTGCELMIPRSEIVTFGRFSEKVFKHFYSNSDMSNKPTELN